MYEFSANLWPTVLPLCTSVGPPKYSHRTKKLAVLTKDKIAESANDEHLDTNFIPKSSPSASPPQTMKKTF